MTPIFGWFSWSHTSSDHEGVSIYSMVRLGVSVDVYKIDKKAHFFILEPL